MLQSGSKIKRQLRILTQGLCTYVQEVVITKHGVLHAGGVGGDLHLTRQVETGILQGRPHTYPEGAGTEGVEGHPDQRPLHGERVV